MAQNTITLHLSANTRWVKPVAWVLYPFVWVGLLSGERAVAIAMRCVRLKLCAEGKE